MPARNTLEWIACGNVPRAKRHVRKDETVQVIIAAVPVEKPDPASKPQPASDSETPKVVHFQDETDGVLKSAMKQGGAAMGNGSREEEAEGTCVRDCTACKARVTANEDEKTARNKNNKSEPAEEGKKPQTRQKGHKQNEQQTKNHAQSSNTHSSSHNITRVWNSKDCNNTSSSQNPNSNNSNNKKKNNNFQHHVDHAQEDPSSSHYAAFIRRSTMSRLIQQPRSEVIVREDVVECPSDPLPNAFFDARIGLLRVYHGPVYGNAMGSLAPLRSGGGVGGSRMVMGGMGGMGEVGSSVPVMSGGVVGGWPGLDPVVGDPANNPYWAPIAGPGAKMGGGRFGETGMRGGDVEGGAGEQRGRGYDHGGNNNPGWRDWRNGPPGSNRNENEGNSKSGNDNQGYSGGREWGDIGNGGNVENYGRQNGSRAPDSNNGNHGWGDNSGGDNNGQRNDDHSYNNPSSNRDGIPQFPGSWHDGNERNYDHVHDRNPATPYRSMNPGWAADNRNAGNFDDIADEEQAWGGESSTRNDYHDNNRNTTSAAATDWRCPPLPSPALSFGSWAGSATGPTTVNRRSSSRGSHGNHGGNGGNGNGNEGTAWGVPRNQASWADPSMAAEVGGGAGGVAGAGDGRDNGENMWR